jgi:hypothetical protein
MSGRHCTIEGALSRKAVTGSANPFTSGRSVGGLADHAQAPLRIVVSGTPISVIARRQRP